MKMNRKKKKKTGSCRGGRLLCLDLLLLWGVELSAPRQHHCFVSFIFYFESTKSVKATCGLCQEHKNKCQATALMTKINKSGLKRNRLCTVGWHTGDEGVCGKHPEQNSCDSHSVTPNLLRSDRWNVRSHTYTEHTVCLKKITCMHSPDKYTLKASSELQPASVPASGGSLLAGLQVITPFFL